MAYINSVLIDGEVVSDPERKGLFYYFKLKNTFVGQDFKEQIIHVEVKTAFEKMVKGDKVQIVGYIDGQFVLGTCVEIVRMCDKNFRDEQLMLKGNPDKKDCMDQYSEEMNNIKKRVLFYWEEAIGGCGAWTPVCNYSLEDLVDFDGLDDEEEREVKFKMFFMTNGELDALPVE